MTDASLRSGIMLDVVETIAAIDGINGVIDDVPFDYATPPRPRPTHGKPYHPFTYVFEGEEQPDFNEFFTHVVSELQITTETTFKYSKTDGAHGLKPTGRALLAAIQRALMVDPNRGTQTLTNGDTVKRAQKTRELFNAIEETAVDGLGVVVSRWGVQYARDVADPGNR